MEDIVCKKCGLINDYKTEKKANNLVATCNGCGSYIKNIPYDEPTLHFGKYNGKKIKEMTSIEQYNYLRWLINNAPKLAPTLKKAIEEHLKAK